MTTVEAKLDRSKTEVPFADGNESAVVNVGNTVRRGPGPWTPASHALLRHLEVAGFDGAPCVLGFDARDRAVLSVIDSVTASASLLGYASDATLVAIADFRPSMGAVWRLMSRHDMLDTWLQSGVAVARTRRPSASLTGGRHVPTVGDSGV